MANEDSFFMRAKVKKERLEEFLAQKPLEPTIDDNWLKWWDSREMYSKSPLDDSLRAYIDTTNRAIIEGLKNTENTIFNSEYDEATEIWHLSMVIFSENYDEMVPFLAFIKSFAPYKEDCPDDFAIVHDYFWGGDSVCAFMDFEGGKALFRQNVFSRSDVDQKKLEYADYYLALKWAEYEKTVNWDY